MLRRSPRRTLALFALALALLAALPCAALATSADACCASIAGCGDAREAPCAQLSVTACCSAGGASQDVSPAPQLPSLSCAGTQDVVAQSVFVDVGPGRWLSRPAPAAFADHAMLRGVLLRL
jgi:hypothetical protein